MARVDYAATATPQQRADAAAVVAAFDWSAAADAAWLVEQERTAAADGIDAPTNDVARLLRALALMVLDEFNLHALRQAQLHAAIAAATSLADFKTRAATVPALPQRTAEQLIAAIKAKL